MRNLFTQLIKKLTNSWARKLQGYILNSGTEQNSIQKGVAQFIVNTNNIGCLLSVLSYKEIYGCFSLPKVVIKSILLYY